MKNPTGLPVGSALGTCGDDFLEILGTLAHNLSQPLTSLQGTIEIALMDQLDVAECRLLLENSLQETRRMAETLDALRDVLEMERVGGETQPVSWTQIIEKILEEGASSNKADCPQLISNVKGEVWVRANPQHLNLATTRLIGGAARGARRRRRVRMVLSVSAEEASLAVFEDGTPLDTEGVSGLETPSPSGKPALGELDKWIVSRAIERQGGRLNVSQTSEACFCYQLNLPLATPEVARTVGP